MQDFFLIPAETIFEDDFVCGSCHILIQFFYVRCLTLIRSSRHENMTPSRCVYVRGRVFALIRERGMGIGLS